MVSSTHTEPPRKELQLASDPGDPGMIGATGNTGEKMSEVRVTGKTVGVAVHSGVNQHRDPAHKRIACQECRQQKARCDAYDRSPDPCTRCAKRGIRCVLNSDYKRKFKRVQIAQMERDYEMMKRRLGAKDAVNEVAAITPTGSEMPSEGIPQFNSLPTAISPSPPYLPPPQGHPLRFQGQWPRYTLPGSSGMVGMVPGISSSVNSSRIAVSPAPTSRSDPIPTIGYLEKSVRPAGSAYPLSSDPLPSRSVHLPATTVGPLPASPAWDIPSTSLTLGNVSLSPPQITSLFSHFVNSYHPLLPVVDTSKGIQRIYRLCPILFWTIMFTALRGFNSPLIPLSEAHRLYFALTPILKSALAELSIAPITRYTPSELDEPVLNVCSVYTVQAFLLYTFWPPLTSSVSADSSWYSLGIAIFQAIRIGIHLPGHSADGLSTQNPDLLAEQLRTWIACNIVSQTIATAFGFPGLNRLDLPRSRGLSHSEVSESLKQMLEIERFESQVAQTLNSNAFDPLMLVGPTERFPMMRLLERELDEMAMKLGVEVGTDSKTQGGAVGAENYTEGVTTKGATYSGSSAPTAAAGTIDGETYGNMDDFRVLCLHASRLHLLTYYFLDTDKVPEFDLSKGLIKAYNAAIKYITHCKFCQEHNPSFALHLPSVYTMTIWQAACIVARLIHSSYSSLIDVPLGRIRYLDAVSLAHEASVIKHDMAYRASGIMRSMWALFKTLNEQNELSPKVVVRSRMCASVFFDSLWILRQKCGMIKLKPDEEAVEESEESDSGKEQVSRPIQRSLSNTLHPESDARKIINTIPLDPQPISLSDKGESGSSSHSSPFMYKSPGERVRPVVRNVSSSSVPVRGGSAKEGPVNGVPVKGVPAKEVPATEAPVFSLDSWDLVNDIDSDLLFKDIDTVMNNFGFHAE